MKMDRYSWIGVTLLLVLLAIPVMLGRIPSHPRRSGAGTAPAISLREEPRKFWSYEASMAGVALGVFAFSRLAQIALKK